MQPPIATQTQENCVIVFFGDKGGMKHTNAARVKTGAIIGSRCDPTRLAARGAPPWNWDAAPGLSCWIRPCVSDLGGVFVFTGIIVVARCANFFNMPSFYVDHSAL